MSIGLTEQSAASLHPSGSDGPRRALILIVDDVEANRERLVDEIELLGHESIEAVNGAEALERLEGEQVECVIDGTNRKA